MDSSDCDISSNAHGSIGHIVKGDKVKQSSRRYET